MRLIHKRGRERIAFPLEEGETYIGRKDYCDIYFPDGSLSKRHARLVRRRGSLTLFDAGSRNGTLLNGEPVEEAELRNGDVIQCGKLRFRVEGIPEDDDSGEEFQLLSGELSGSGARASEPRRSRSRRSRSRGSEEASVFSAQAVASADARDSMLGVLPEVAPSFDDEEAYDPDAPTEPYAILRLVEGGPPTEFPLLGDLVTIGSKADNDVVISGEGVSRYHAEMIKEAEGWVLKDLGARNGLFIAGDRIDFHMLQPGDEVQIGTIKLRFEMVTPKGTDAFSELLAKLKADPVAAFKEDQRLRLGAIALLVAAFLAFMVLPSGGRRFFPGRGGRVEHGPWLSEGSEHLVAGRYKAARDVFRKAKVHVSPQSQDVPRALERLAAQWLSLEKGPSSFRWGKAKELLRGTARIKGLPESLRSWIDEQSEFVELNKKAYEDLNKARALGRVAKGFSASADLLSILDAYTKANRTYSEVASSSLFAEDAGKEAEALSKLAFKTALRVVKKRMRADNPNWAQTATLIEQVRDYAQTTPERQAVRRLAEECEINRHDEALYVAATKLINTRRLSKYPDAQQLLERIDRRSRIYADAQAYIDWIDADLKVRDAKRAYDLGDARQAFQLLSEAMRFEAVGPDGKASVRQRRQSWARVVRAYDRGMQLFNEGQGRAAKGEFERVIKLEPNTRNRYHIRARDQIKHIVSTEAYDLKRKLREGLSALKRDDFRSALRWFSQVREDANHRDRDLQQIRHAVSKKNERGRLMRAAKAHLINDRSEHFIEIRDVFKMLTIWLPAGDKDRKEARKHLKSVIARLKNWKAGALGRPR